MPSIISNVQPTWPKGDFSEFSASAIFSVMEVVSLASSSDSQRNEEQRSSIEENLNLGLADFPPLSNSLEVE